MFILPLSLCLLASYVRFKTIAELSYLATAIELTSGLLCVLTAPFQVQVCILLYLFVAHNRRLRTSLAGNQPLWPTHTSLSCTEPDLLTLDIPSQTVLTQTPPETVKRTSSESLPKHKSDSATQNHNPLTQTTTATNSTLSKLSQPIMAHTSSLSVLPMQDNSVETKSQVQAVKICRAHIQSELSVQLESVICTYRGVTYLKQVSRRPKSPNVNRHCQYRGTPMEVSEPR